MEIKNKKLIRRMMIDLRNQMEKDDVLAKSEVICSKILQSECYQRANNLLLYLDCGNEVMTNRLLEDAWKQKKKVFCPKVIGSEIEFYEITETDDLTAGYKGIMEPNGTSSLFSEDRQGQLEDTLVIIPGVAFDQRGNRIGYGKGFYDRFLKRYQGIRKVAICYDYQVVEEIEASEYDEVVETVYTESREWYGRVRKAGTEGSQC